MKNLIFIIAAIWLSSTAGLAQSWTNGGSVTNVLYPTDNKTRVGVGISNTSAFNNSNLIYSGAKQVKLLVESSRSGSTIDTVGNIGHLLKGNFGGDDSGDVWSTLGGPGFQSFANEPIYGLKIQYEEYAVNLDMADRAIVDNGFSASPNGTIDAVLFWDPGLNGISDGDFIIGPTVGNGEIDRRIWLQADGDIEINAEDNEGDITLNGGDGGSQAGDVTIEGGSAFIPFSSTGGDVIIRAGSGDTDDGEIRLIGDSFVNGSVITSDERFKKDINPIGEEAKRMGRLNPVTYKYDREKHKDMRFNSSLQYGFIAQELEEVFPHLVVENKDGYKYVNYNGLIPIIVKSMNAQNKKVDSLVAVIEKLTKKDEDSESAKMSSNSDEGSLPNPGSVSSELFQNTPNPFSNSTEIRFSVAEGAESASLYIYDMNGLQLKSIPINGRGESSLSISGGELKAGMYLYSLIVDGQEVETKRMILTR